MFAEYADRWNRPLRPQYVVADHASYYGSPIRHSGSRDECRICPLLER